MTPRAIHQFHAGSAVGDGVTNAMFYLQAILRESGFASDIHCANIAPPLAGRIRDHRDYADHPDDVLLVHYSLGTEQDAWITGLRCHKILIYHNLTPEHFFPLHSGFRRWAEAGRTQLVAWATQGVFAGAIGVSDYNSAELRGWGFAPVATVGILVDLDRLRGLSIPVARAADGVRTLLFVGRLVAHKGQRALVAMMRHLRARCDLPVRLVLAGAADGDGYDVEVLEAIAAAGLAGDVEIVSGLDDAGLCALYRSADLYVSMSQHEGFGMPLVEAMLFDLPVLALAAGSVAATLGPGGLVLAEGGPAEMAATANLILHEPSLRRQIIAGQRASLARFERPLLVAEWQAFLRGLGLEVTLAAGSAPRPAQVWTVEGPFDSSYSLAMVNRSLARALAQEGMTLGLVSRDGPGPFKPDDAFLAGNSDLAAMADFARIAPPPDVNLRNQYPPDVADMRGAMRVLANFAWEESGFPAERVREFNVSLDLITVTSRFVEKVLRDNGVRVPIRVVGNGVDHVPAGPHVAGEGVFRFLHISSGFPRKGVDVLLAAWAAAFGRDDAVTLTIKTFANIHNRTAAQLDAFRAAHPAAAPVTLIETDLDAEGLAALYRAADAVVCPSRGEGFGLPLAEAMSLGIPVIATGHGGALDFCDATTAWLCEWRFAYARSHLGLPDSVWVEPDAESLAGVMRTVIAAPEERARRVVAAQARVRAAYSWAAVARRTQAAVAAVRAMPASLRRPVIGVVSTWNSRCGIAAYAKSQFAPLPPSRLRVFASHVPETTAVDEPFVTRCWVEGWEDPLDELFQELSAANVDAVVIQFNFAFFRLAMFGRLLDRLRARGIATFVVLHATADVDKPGVTIRLGDIAAELGGVRRLLVHAVDDLNRLKSLGLVDTVALLPMGVPPPPFAPARRAGRTVASFGYLLPHKGLRELIGAFALLRRTMPDLHLLMLNALYPVPESEAELRACRQDIARLGLQAHVTLETGFLTEEAVLARLGGADVVAYPYQHTQESASGAVKLGLAALVPVAITPLPIFSDIEHVCHALPGTTSEAIAEGLAALLGDHAGRAALQERQRTWAAAHGWAAISGRLDGLIRGTLES